MKFILITRNSKTICYDTFDALEYWSEEQKEGMSKDTIFEVCFSCVKCNHTGNRELSLLTVPLNGGTLV